MRQALDTGGCDFKLYKVAKQCHFCKKRFKLLDRICIGIGKIVFGCKNCMAWWCANHLKPLKPNGDCPVKNCDEKYSWSVSRKYALIEDKKLPKEKKSK